jgi:hypothetical protein
MNNTPVFIKIDSYKEVLDIIDVIKAKLDKSKSLLKQINQIKAEEDEELLEWQTTLDNISDKVYFIDKTLFEPNI